MGPVKIRALIMGVGIRALLLTEALNFILFFVYIIRRMQPPRLWRRGTELVWGPVLELVMTKPIGACVFRL